MKLDADGKRCVTPEALLVYARQTDLRRVSLGDGVTDDYDVLIGSGVKQATAVDCHVIENRIYWTDTSTEVHINIQ